MTNRSLTRGTSRIIRQAISNLPEEKKNNKYSVCEEVASILVTRFIGDPDDDNFESMRQGRFNYQTQRMGLRTTREIMNKIELYVMRKHRG